MIHCDDGVYLKVFCAGGHLVAALMDSSVLARRVPQRRHRDEWNKFLCVIEFVITMGEMYNLRVEECDTTETITIMCKKSMMLHIYFNPVSDYVELIICDTGLFLENFGIRTSDNMQWKLSGIECFNGERLEHEFCLDVNRGLGGGLDEDWSYIERFPFNPKHITALAFFVMSIKE